MIYLILYFSDLKWPKKVRWPADIHKFQIQMFVVVCVEITFIFVMIYARNELNVCIEA